MDERRQRFTVLLQQIQLSPEVAAEHFADGTMEQVVVHRNNRKWHFILGKQKLLPLAMYTLFYEATKRAFQSIAEVSMQIRYAEQVSTPQLVSEYWPYFVQWVQTNNASINGWLANAQLDCSERHICLKMADETALKMAEMKNMNRLVSDFYEQHFARQVDMKLAVVSHEQQQEQREQFERRRQEQEREAIEQMMTQIAAAPTESTEAQLLQVGYDIKDEPVLMNTIVDEEKKVTVQGTVFGLEVKELRNGSTLYMFHLTDYTDSLSIKMFGKTKEDVRTLSALKNGKWLKMRGKIEYDRFMQEPELVMVPNDVQEVGPPAERQDDAPVKRVEFHLHTVMSAMDAVTSIDSYAKQAAKWGHKAIAVTDHSNIHCFPDAAKAAKKYGINVMYGVEANVVNDAIPVVMNAREQSLTGATYIVFDIETTGLSVTANKIIELAAIRWVDGKEAGRFSTFVHPHENIPYHIQQLTNITNEMVQDAPELEPQLKAFIEFIGDDILVAHNARFDIGFMQAACRQFGLPALNNPVLDTLELARLLYPKLKNHRLNTLADKYKVSLENHHRAIDDSLALAGVLNGLLNDAMDQGLTTLASLNARVGQDLSNVRPFHCQIYALNAVGKKNLFKLVSISHTEYFKRVACIPKSKLREYRDGLLVVSGCEKGEFFETVLNKSQEEAEKVAEYYDVLEIQPLGFYMHLVERGLVTSRLQLEQTVKRICEIGEKLGKPVIATGNVHYLAPRDKIFRDITIHGITGFSPLKDMNKPDAHFRTTEEMLAEFAFLGEQKAYEVVVTNTNALADRFETFQMFPKELFTPIIEGADDEIRNTCYATARRLYGEELPEVVIARLEKELVPIIKYGFSANYLISERLVKKSNQDGYLVGSRGSVGSSVVATFLGISEVNPLPAHYLCLNEQCRYSEWFLDGSYPSGFDLPNKPCPHCGQPLKGEGQDIPFETFLGFKGDKVPDIDLSATRC